MEEIIDGMKKALVLTEEEKSRITIGEEEFDQGDIVDDEIEKSLIGTLLTERLYRSDYMKSTMVEAWRLKGKVEIRDVEKNLYMFKFEDREDMNKVVTKGPWNFENSLLLLEKPNKNTNPNKIVFSEVAFWVQIHNLPIKAMRKTIIMKIGNSMGRVEMVDEDEYGIKWGAYIRIRVRININKPLQRGSIIEVPGVGEIWIQYKYERLPRICRWCGVLGHNEGNCSKRKDEGSGEYDDLRAAGEVMRSKIYEPKKQNSYNSASVSAGDKFEGRTSSGKDESRSNDMIRVEENMNENNRSYNEEFLYGEDNRKKFTWKKNLEDMRDTASSPSKENRSYATNKSKPVQQLGRNESSVNYVKDVDYINMEGELIDTATSPSKNRNVRKEERNLKNQKTGIPLGEDEVQGLYPVEPGGGSKNTEEGIKRRWKRVARASSGTDHMKEGGEGSRKRLGAVLDENAITSPKRSKFSEVEAAQQPRLVQ